MVNDEIVEKIGQLKLKSKTREDLTVQETIINPNEAFIITDEDLIQAYEELIDEDSEDIMRSSETKKIFFVFDRIFDVIGEVFKWFAIQGLNIKKEGKMLQILYEHQPLEREEFIEILDSENLVSKNRNERYAVVKEFERTGLVEIVKSKKRRSRGRPPDVLILNEENMKEFFDKYDDEDSYEYFLRALSLLDTKTLEYGKIPIKIGKKIVW